MLGYSGLLLSVSKWPCHYRPNEHHNVAIWVRQIFQKFFFIVFRSKSVVFDLPCVNITKDVCAGRQWVVNQVSRVGDIGSCFRYDLPSRRHPGCLGTQPLVNQRACRDFEQGGGGRGSETIDERNGTNGFRTTGKTVKNGSPPRACPRNSKPCRESQNDDHGTCNGDQGGTCPIDRDGSSGCHRTRWDDGFTQDQTKLSDLEGDHYYITASGHYAGKNVSDSERDSSVISESSREHRKETPQEKRYGGGGRGCVWRRI